ncbi:fungal-specific transcription factor domain-containing protein [Cercophora newfieldiana]|uniref:Fungal-specific transcription factor domain-containing protein n=1 Tax=Cercophora newfieldiana TaxID=92897 RepID=A0AA39XW08_9PEZI|nr:fungal-specific transcription factor domain-containing protein [Cercophora newfieldiana]
MGEDLYGLLVRMSLGDDNLPAQATRHAIAAISYQHIGQDDAALSHKTNSISALQKSVDLLSSGKLDTKEAFQAMAASMLLNIFENLYSAPTVNLIGSAIACAIFLCGSKRLAGSIHKPHATYDGDCAMILDWIFYHDTMYKFSSRHWYAKRTEPTPDESTVVSKAAFSPMRQIILPATGCSLELLDLLYQTISAVYDRTDPRHLDPAHVATLRKLDYRIKNITQVTRVQPISSDSSLGSSLDSSSDHSSPSSWSSSPTEGSPKTSESMAHPSARFYSYAVNIYLLRVAQGLPSSLPAVSSLIDSAFETLSSLPFCERPWPIFVVALEARTEDERWVVLDKIDAAIRAKPLGNMAVAREMVTRAWVQKDFASESRGYGEGEDMLAVYNAAVRGFGPLPSFA